MVHKSLHHQEIFIARAFRQFGENVASGFARANEWQRRSVQIARRKFMVFDAWFGKHWESSSWWLAGILWIGYIGWGVVQVALGKVETNGEIISMFLISLPFAGILVGALLIFLSAAFAIDLFNRIFSVLASIFLFLPLILWIPIYAFWQAMLVMAKFLLLIPLAILFIVTRFFQLWRGIFYTCPSRHCAYRGLPIYVCPQCSTGNRKLWPNLYGLLWHHCVKCDACLPALDLLGRKHLHRRCGNCKIPLQGKHAGRVPERLVAIVGGPSAGKTNYLFMAVHAITNGAMQIRGEIDDKTQAEEFRRGWQDLAVGLPAAKTTEVRKAFLLYAKFGRAKCQLYLYDAPGEEFTSISSMTQQQYFPLLEGFILLVDPLSFEAVRWRVGGLNSEILSLQEVVNSTLVTALSGVPLERNGKSSMRVAVVISKADLECVREQIGDIKQKSIAGEVCRKAIASWGGENALRAIEHRFESVKYFACSPLGRAVDTNRREPFKGSGVLEPLRWILTGELEN